MRFNTLLFLITAFLLVNTYYDNKYTDMLKVNKKYIKMAMIGFTALTIYVFFRKFPSQGNAMLVHANDIIKYMPIDRHSKDILTPLIDLTMNRETGNLAQQGFITVSMTPQEKRMMNSGKRGAITQKRSVSETKKKYVASRQQWSCGHCQQQLDHTFEVDHIQDLQYGGDRRHPDRSPLT